MKEVRSITIGEMLDECKSEQETGVVTGLIHRVEMTRYHAQQERAKLQREEVKKALELYRKSTKK